MRRLAAARRLAARPGAALACAAALCIVGCSEKPDPQVLAWEPLAGIPVRNLALTGVGVLPNGAAIGIGHQHVEGTTSYAPYSILHTGAGWFPLPLPLPAMGGSTQLHDAAVAPDGAIWACGRVVDDEREPSRTTPIVYRCAGGSWSEVRLGGIGDPAGLVLAALAAAGAGAEFEVRAVGSAANASAGVALRYAGGSWRRDSLPPPPGATAGWTLEAVGRDPAGRWIAAGGAAGGAGAVVYVDDGSGWRLVPAPPGHPALQLTDVGFDAGGAAWLAGNETVGDSLQGALFRYDGAGFSSATVVRRSTGRFWINRLGFDALGHGWAVGGRGGNQPFLAALEAGTWTEALARPEREAGGALAGGQLFGVCVLSGDLAFAVGYGFEPDPEGGVEAEAIFYRLLSRPAGETDGITRALDPLARSGAGGGRATR